MSSRVIPLRPADKPRKPRRAAVPPHSIELEEAVLSVILFDNSAIERAQLNSEDFYLGAHRRVHGAMLAMSQRRVRIDALTLIEELRSRGELDSVGGKEYIASLIGKCFTADGVEEHARIVREKAKQREFMALAERFSLEARDASFESTAFARRYHETFRSFLATIDVSAVRRRWRLASEIAADPASLAEPFASIPYLAWRERVTLLVGREKESGKTTLTATAAAKKSRGGTHCGERLSPGRVLWVMAEGHPNDVLRIMHRAGADLDQIAFHYDLGEDRLGELEAQILDFKPDAVVVDTLASFAEDQIDDARNSAKWTPIVNRLATIARKGNTAIVVNAHARKSDGKARDSTAITAGVDMILTLESVADNASARRVRALGRWPIADHTIALEGSEYRLLTGGEISLEMKVLDFLRANPNASKSRIRDGVGGKATTVDKALIELCERGIVMREVDKTGHRYQLPTFSRSLSGTGLGTDTTELAKSLQDMAGRAPGRGDPVPDSNSVESGDRVRSGSTV